MEDERILRRREEIFSVIDDSDGTPQKLLLELSHGIALLEAQEACRKRKTMNSLIHEGFVKSAEKWTKALHRELSIFESTGEVQPKGELNAVHRLVLLGRMQLTIEGLVVNHSEHFKAELIATAQMALTRYKRLFWTVHTNPKLRLVA